MSFWVELKRRNVFKVGVAYAVIAWLLIQIADTLLPTFGAPGWVMPVFSTAIMLGFPIALILAWAFELTPEGVRTTAALDRDHGAARAAGDRLNYVITALLVVAVVYMFVDNYVLDRPSSVDEGRRDAADRTLVSPAAATPADTAGNDDTARSAGIAGASNRNVPPNSVAVLPFDNLSPNEDDSYFAAGMYEEVLNQLAKLKNLRVISRTSMMRYADSGLSIPEIARELNVGAVMEGSVRYAGDRVRITAQLIDAETDQHIWSDSYDRDLADVFGIQADIAMNIANALLVEFTPDEQQLIENVPTESTEAYALFLRALETNDRNEALSMLLDAVRIDPKFALGYANIATNYAFGVINSDGFAAMPVAERTDVEARVQEYAKRALAIDPSLGRAYYALALPALVNWRWSEAIEAFERVSEVAPAQALPHYVLLLSALGRHDEALAVAERQLPIQPENPNAGWFGYALGWAGDYNAAAEVFERLSRSDPRYLTGRDWLAFMEIARGDPAAAITQLEFSERLAGDQPLIVFLPEWAYSYGRVGRSEDARRLFDAMQRAEQQGGRPGAGGWAMANLAIGDNERALEWLEIAAEKTAKHEPDEGFFNLINLKMNVTNDPVLEQPEFVDVRNRIRGD